VALSQASTARNGRLAAWAPRAVLALALFLASCGGSGGAQEVELGTVALRNESNLGMAPLTIEQFFLQPVGVTDAGSNRLSATLPPGGTVIVGLFPPGLYNGVAVLQGGFNVNFQDMEVRAGQATNFIVP
jgi:hypothetical protein